MIDLIDEQETRAAIANQHSGLSPYDVLTAYQGELMRRDFVEFAQTAWSVIEPKRCRWNWHMDAMAEHLVYLTQREIRCLMIMVPPRMTKSLLCTVLWPVWHWLQTLGTYSLAGTQFITASYNAKLAEEHSQLARRIIESGWFRQYYAPDFYLLHDENRKDMYRNDKGGYRLTTSVGGRTTGEGGDVQLMDDPHNAQQVESDVQRQSALEWHDNSWRSRVNDPNRAQKLYVAQRTHDNDILGHLLVQEPNRWVQLMLPMEFDPKRKCITYCNRGTGNVLTKKIFEDPRKVDGELLNPKRFNKETARVEKASGMTPRAWNAQYQQQPEGAGGLILKRGWWRPWVYPEWHPSAGKDRQLPEFTEIVQVYDTAFSEEEEEEGDFTACTTWGIFPYREAEKDPNTGKIRDGDQRMCAIMLHSFDERLGFPELRQRAIELDAAFAPDVVLIEKKASGQSLVQELRRKKVPVRAVKIDSDTGDLVARAHESSLMLSMGCIWYVPRQWSFHVIDNCAKFPVADHDDLVSSCTMAWMYMRKFYDLELPDDDKPGADLSPFRWKRRRKYA